MKTLIYLSALFVLVITIVSQPIGAVAEDESTAERIIFSKVNFMKPQSNAERIIFSSVDFMKPLQLRNYIESHPSGEDADAARLFLWMHDKMAAIKNGDEKAGFIIPFSLVDTEWSSFATRLGDSYYKSRGYESMPQDISEEWVSYLHGPIGEGLTFITVTVNRDSSISTKALHSFFMLMGGQGWVSGGRTVWRDDQEIQGGYPVFPGDGSIFGIETSGIKYEWVNDIAFQTPGDELMYFGVLDDIGLIHLYGEGMVILSDGSENKFENEPFDSPK